MVARADEKELSLCADGEHAVTAVRGRDKEGRWSGGGEQSVAGGGGGWRTSLPDENCRNNVGKSAHRSANHRSIVFQEYLAG